MYEGLNLVEMIPGLSFGDTVPTLGCASTNNLIRVVKFHIDLFHCLVVLQSQCEVLSVFAVQIACVNMVT